MEISYTLITLINCHVRRRIFNAQQNRTTRRCLKVKLLMSFTFNFQQQLELEETQMETLHYMKHLFFFYFKLNHSLVNITRQRY